MSTDSRSGPSAGVSPQYVGEGHDEMQRTSSNDIDPALGPLERLQRKWGIGDRKTRDGQPAKRRGPKPDSKPALTRRQELNRQAQRTHRERKENYMHDLEIALDDLRGRYARDVTSVKEENKKLKELLAAHGIPYDGSSPGVQSYTSPSSVVGAPSTNSASGYASHSTGYNSPSNQAVSNMAMANTSQSFQNSSPQPGALPQPRNNIHGLDYEDVGLDFVATLEQNCTQHQQLMVFKSVEDENWVCGHALMATVPPREHCEQHGMNVPYPHKLPDLPKPDLARMLDLCTQLPGLNDELTPVMAWAFLLSHPACPEMTKEDFTNIKNDLQPKVACYGFGAVLENFEVEDAIHKVLTTKNANVTQSSGVMEWDMVRSVNAH